MTASAPPRSPALTGRITGPRLLAWALILAGVLVLAMALCSLAGMYQVSWPLWRDPLWRSHLPRVFSAAVAGMVLGAAGVALQSLLRNPLADPFVLGVSSGGGVGVMLGIMLLNIGGLWRSGSHGALVARGLLLPAAALAGAMATMLLVYLISQRRGRLDPYTLLLGGVIVNSFNMALMLFIYLYASPYEMVEYVRWAIGRVPESPNPYLLQAASTVGVAGWAFLFLRAHAFNVHSLGDDVAASSGVRVPALRMETFVVASLLAAAAVALAGPIGFVGLIIPHICRMVLGTDHRLLVIASGFVGALFLLLADTFCRSTVLLFGGELPVGIISAFAGGPFFIYLLRRRFREVQR